MPDLRKSVLVDGKYYCYDRKTKKFYEVKTTFDCIEVDPVLLKIVQEMAKRDFFSAEESNA